jgi:hypothetical protein
VQAEEEVLRTSWSLDFILKGEERVESRAFQAGQCCHHLWVLENSLAAGDRLVGKTRKEDVAAGSKQ